ncbi:sigma-70 family RNA polymerase sigma factor [Sandaracinus amylolyticus]|uniref:sigma-70 family RNA polymerase sigma factor n=1 Tax=Sandaracinus amylolyticus TaxID=927083 RepID=UPI001F41158D|nr:sigma-70 family RNA polymerase sigma factor [Sandaracinus amylolyticus]UJR84948.1 Hypothetical protein I5071_70270 [Sandaracinus amylolyticus]
MTAPDELADEFERSRARLRAVALRMLGSGDDADDAVQETWLRASRAGARDVESVSGWLRTILGRVCLDMLRARRRRGEVDLEEHDVPTSPDDELAHAESVGLALLVVLERLGPDERIAFVLHDLFGVPFEEIAVILERSPVAAKKVASRARHRVVGARRVHAPDTAEKRRVVEAFLAASRAGDVAALLAVLAPDVVRRADRVALPSDGERELRGARRVADETRHNAARARDARVIWVDGELGVVVAPRGRLAIVLRLAIEGDRITAIDVIAEPARVRAVDLAVLETDLAR